MPRLRQGIASAYERRRFLGAVSAELALMTVIVAVTAVLVSAPPARTESSRSTEPPSRSSSSGRSRRTSWSTRRWPGPNTIRLELMEGEIPATGVSEVRIAATLPSRGIGPLRFTTRAGGEPGMYAVRGAQLPIAGDWQLRIEVRRGEFELLTETVMVRVEEEL